MAWWKPWGSKTRSVQRTYAPNPHTDTRVRSAGFFSMDVNRLLMGWDSSSSSIDYYLMSELKQLRARSRKMVRANPYGKRFIATMKANIVGPSGVSIQAHNTQFRPNKGEVLDTRANEALEAAFRDWSRWHCDYLGKSDWVDLQNLAISCAAQDGEFIFRKRYRGKYGFQLEAIDSELLDAKKNESGKKREIRLGVEYNKAGRIVGYWFREKTNNQYDTGKSYRVDASEIIHGFISEWPDQSRGAPWMHASLERSKHLEKYDEAAIVKARATASTMTLLKSGVGDAYAGDEEYGDGVTLDQYDPGTIKDIGDRDVVHLDSSYPHQMYSSFVKSQLQGIASGLGISYHSLANDLEGVNYSSIRAGVLEDREVFKGLQNWFVRQFVMPVYEEWVKSAVPMGLVKIGNVPLSRPAEEYLSAHYQPRRWAWVDPQKDGAANQMAVDYRMKSRSQIMREQGDDPDSVWREIQRETEIMDQLGIAPVVHPPMKPEEESSNG